MKLIHTADWHLGRIFYGRHLTGDQAHVLERFVELAADFKPDAVLIAGDVYDRAVPPIEAVRLLDDVLSRIVAGLEIPVVLIAGNHDSPERLAFGSGLLRDRKLVVAGAAGAAAEPVMLEDRHGPLAVSPIPFAEPALVRQQLDDEAVRDHAGALAALLDRARARIPPGCRSVAVAHAWIIGGEESESERPLSLGGSGQVSASVFDGFHYAALGHLHRPQSVGEARIRYPGSLLKYSFSEARREKSVDLVEIDGKGRATVESVPLEPCRNLRCIRGLLDDVLADPGAGDWADDYIMVTLEDRGALLDVMNRLRSVYPNVLHIERDRFGLAGDGDVPSGDHLNRTEEEMMTAFYRDVTGEDMSTEEREQFLGVLGALSNEEKEESA
jgi:exonuclease SbcD